MEQHGAEAGLLALEPESSKAAVAAALDELREHYDVDGHGVELVEIGGGWQILTRAEYTEAIERAQLASRPARRRTDERPDRMRSRAVDKPPSGATFSELAA